MQHKSLPQEASNVTPDLSKLRPGLFWDTDIKRIDWISQRQAVIERVTERGNDDEIAEIKSFYGEESFNQTVDYLKLKRP
jgi:antitoxin HigA-1